MFYYAPSSAGSWGVTCRESNSCGQIEMERWICWREMDIHSLWCFAAIRASDVSVALKNKGNLSIFSFLPLGWC